MTHDGKDAALARCFAPVVNANTQVLILGSLPGAASLAAQQYYAHPRNRFWPLLAAVLKQPDLPALAYPARLQALLAAGVGLWDVVAQAQRRGSLDANIRDAQANPLPALIAQLGERGTRAAIVIAAGLNTKDEKTGINYQQETVAIAKK